ncbi:MAG: hypothetical protein DRQ46_00250 [Gammaproteobacteria bacterium]|nr:MAG: hypothetical protein DRQ46_00250 [Gammaproteobacteria bacterium]
MALRKEYIYKNYVGEYWKIISFTLNSMNYTIISELGLFKDLAARQGGDKNRIEREIKTIGINDLFPDDSPLEQSAMLAELLSGTVSDLTSKLYANWKKSNIQQRYVVVDGEIQLDGNGNKLTEDYEANWFADAEDIIEV